MRLVVVGGGVAGTSCALQLCKLCPESTITLVAPDATLKVSKVRTNNPNPEPLL